MITRRVWRAILIAFLCHGTFVIAAHYRFSYDAYTHMLFADHYAKDWFSLWEPRWYTGFTVVSYPPLVHQLIALFIPALGFDRAFALILWSVATLYPLGVYAFSRIFTDKTAASYAALASALLTPIYVTAHVFGQLPFLTSTLIALFGAASLDRYLSGGRFLDLVLTVSLAMTTMATHHATLIVQPFLLLAVVMAQTNKVHWRTLLHRLLLYGVSAITVELMVVWPFWQWGARQAMQTPIDHLSRHDFIADPLAFAIFFLPLYGPLIAVIPFMFCKWPRRFWGLLVSFAILFILGLGGTTPLPRLIFGEHWAWLTYDRFAFWASLALLPFFGILFIRLKRRCSIKPGSASIPRRLVSAFTASIFTLTIVLVWLQPLLLPTQPAPIDMQPIVKFLDQGDRSQWRYLTFGFGNQYTYLNLLTKATTIDGSYHTARTLPELRESGIAEIDTAFWSSKGVSAIRPILLRAGEHGVRWGFVGRDNFIPELVRAGWVFERTLSNGIQVWEDPNAVLLDRDVPPTASHISSLSWGLFPLLAFVTTLVLGTLRTWPIEGERGIRHMYSFAIGLVPITLCFWSYRSLGGSPHDRVYFIYDHAQFFLSDGLVSLAVFLWLTISVARNGIDRNSIDPPRSIFLIFAICLLTTISILWSKDWRISLFISLHFWLVYMFILALRDQHGAWKISMFGLCSALSIELITGFIGYALQSTAFLDVLQMEWPGILDPSMRGASVVQLADGARILRAYGTLPHPNILGGFTLITLLGPASIFLTSKKQNIPALLLFCMGIMLIGLTFSRSAWLGSFAFMIILILRSKYFARKQLVLLIAASILTLMLTLFPLRNLVVTRVSNAPVAIEQLSMFGREWLTQQAMDMLHTHPLTGVGIGSFIIELAGRAVPGALIEPVHNIFLLAGSELGIFGMLLVIGLFLSIALDITKTKTPQAVIASAMLTGLGVISLFDHYLWTLAPGRIMLGLALGLWAGQAAHDA